MTSQLTREVNCSDIFGRRHLPSKCAWKIILQYTEDIDVVFTKKSSSLLTLERGQ